MAGAPLGLFLTVVPGPPSRELNHVCNNQHFPVNPSNVYPPKEMDGQEAEVRLFSHSCDVTTMI